MKDTQSKTFSLSEDDARRFWSRTEVSDGCMRWKGGYSKGGYGKISVGGRDLYAHRVAFVLAGGQLIAGMTIDHLCRNRACVNASHLQQVSNEENARGHIPWMRTHCAQGHELAAENTRVEPNGNGNRRRCLTCRRARDRERRQLRSAALPSDEHPPYA